MRLCSNFLLSRDTLRCLPMTFAAINNTVPPIKSKSFNLKPITLVAPHRITLFRRDWCYKGGTRCFCFHSFLTNCDVCSADVLQGTRKPVVVGLLSVPQQPVCQGRPALGFTI